MTHSLSVIKKRSVTGVFITGIAQAISLSGGFILSILLDPGIFGIYTVIAASTVFLGYFSDIGLAAALIQKKNPLTQKDLATTFTIQQMLVVCIVIGTLLLSGVIGHARGFTSDGMLLFRALIISFFLSSLKTIPSILLERELNFKKLVVPQVAEIIAFNAAVIPLVIMGWGITSFVYAVLARGVIGVIAIYYIQPWMPRIAFDKKSAKQLVSFGVPFQLNSIIALLKDNIFIMILPFLMPIEHVGYIGWAKKWSEVPLRLLMDNIIRITFPAYARLQNYPDKLSRGIEKTLFFLMLCIIPMSVGMVFLIEPLMGIIPRYSKWIPALSSFYLFVIASVVAGISSPLLNALNAIGKISVTLKFMIAWTIMQWTIAPLLITLIGFSGFAWTTVIMALTTIIVIQITIAHIPFRMSPNILPFIVAGLGMAGSMFLTHSIGIASPTMLIIWSVWGSIVYVGILYMLFREKVVSEIMSLVHIVRA